MELIPLELLWVPARETKQSPALLGAPGMGGMGDLVLCSIGMKLGSQEKAGKLQLPCPEQQDLKAAAAGASQSPCPVRLGLNWAVGLEFQTI